MNDLAGAFAFNVFNVNYIFELSLRLLKDVKHRFVALAFKICQMNASIHT